MTAGSESFGLGGGATNDESAAATKASSSLNDLSKNAVGVAGSMGSLLGSLGAAGQALGLNTETVQGLTTAGQILNTTTTAYNATQQILNMLGLTQTSTETTLATSMATLQIAVVELTSAMISAWTQINTKATTSAFGFANGGIMTSGGPMPLSFYSNGGIANKAQVAVFGEGSSPEAFVPLPDGRSIPVTLNAGNNGEQVGGNNVSIVINVTGSGDSTSETQSGTGSDGDKSLDDSRKLANAIKTAVKNEIYNQSRPGGMLYNR